MRDQPQPGEQQLPADVREGGENAPADRSEPALRQANGEGQHDQAEHRASQAHEETRREKLPEQQTTGKHPQAADPGGSNPAVACQDDQRHDIGQPRLDAGQRQGNRRIDQRQTDCRRRQLRDAVVFGRGTEFDQRARHQVHSIQRPSDNAASRACRSAGALKICALPTSARCSRPSPVSCSRSARAVW